MKNRSWRGRGRVGTNLISHGVRVGPRLPLAHLCFLSLLLRALSNSLLENVQLCNSSTCLGLGIIAHSDQLNSIKIKKRSNRFAGKVFYDSYFITLQNCTERGVMSQDEH